MIARMSPQNFHLTPICPISAISVATTKYVNSLASRFKLFYDAVNLIQHYSYSSFGKILKVSDAASLDVTNSPVIKTPYAFTGREYDRESGLYHYRARVYDPSVGRFLQVDPHPGKRVMPKTITSRYSYVENNPINFADPRGKFKKFIKKVGRGIGKVTKPLLRSTVGQIITTAVILGGVALSGGTLAPFLIAGAIGGVAGAAFMDGNPFKNFVAGFTGGVLAAGGDDAYRWCFFIFWDNHYL